MKPERLRKNLTAFLGILTGAFLLFAVAILFQMWDAQRSLREATYDQGGIAGIQIRLHFEKLIAALVRLETAAPDASVEETVTQYDIFYERLRALPTRPPYDLFLDAEVLGLIDRQLVSLGKEVETFDRAAEGDASALIGMRKRLEPLRFGINRISSLSTQLASKYRSANRARMIHTADWLAVLIICLMVSGFAFVAIVWRQMRNAEIRNRELAELTVDLENANQAILNEIVKRDKAEDVRVDSEIRVRHAEVVLQHALDSIDDGFAIMDSDDRLVLWNSQYKESFRDFGRELLKPGASFEGLVREITRRGYYVEGVDDVEAYVAQRLVRHRNLPNTEVREVSDGRYVKVSEYPTSDGGSVILRSDITELKERELALSMSEQRFRGIFDESVAAIYVFDKEKSFIDSNQAGLDLLGYSKEELLSMGLSDMDDDPVAVLPALEQLFSGERLVNYEHRLRRKNGHVITVLNNSNPLSDPQGNIVGMESTLIDITDRKQAEQHANELVAAIDALSESVVLFDAEDRLVFANKQSKSLNSAISEILVPGSSAENLFKALMAKGQIADARGREDEWLRERMEFRLNPEGSFEVERQDGHWELVREQRLSDGGMISLSTDITEHKRLEEQLRRAQKMEAVGHLVGGIAHDFNNILGIVMGNLEILQRTVSGNDVALDRARKALKGAERGVSLTRKLLGFSSKEAHGAKPSSLNEFIKNMEELLVKSLTVAIKVKNRLDDDLWTVNVDQGELEDTILNLALNARDAMPDGGVLTIETANKTFDGGCVMGHPQGKVGEYVMLSISDTGRGMTSEERERIFEPFFTTKEEGQGTGLGLSMVYGFVQRSMGDIEILTAPGEGTTFRIYLSRANEEGITEDQNASQIRLLTGSEVILVVDDEEVLVDIATLHLKELGYRTLKAHNGEQALKILKDNKDIDLLFSDVIMPGELDGYQLAIAAQKARPSLKVLLASGFAKKKEDHLSPDGLRYIELARDLLKKPYSHTELASAVRIILDRIG